MPRFTITQFNTGVAPEEFIAGDSGQVLARIHRLGWSCADVARDGVYQFSLSLNRGGVWSLTRKDTDARQSA